MLFSPMPTNLLCRFAICMLRNDDESETGQTSRCLRYYNSKYSFNLPKRAGRFLEAVSCTGEVTPLAFFLPFVCAHLDVLEEVDETRRRHLPSMAFHSLQPDRLVSLLLH